MTTVPTLTSASREDGWATGLLHELFERQARLVPDRTALVCGEHTMSYRELDEHTTRMAGALAARGAGPGEVVAVCVPASRLAMIGQLAVLKTGATYVPLDPANPPTRLAQLVETVRPVVVLTMSGGPCGLPDELVIDELAGDSPVVRGGAAITPDDPAYLLFTSGSTGRPKGVVVPHAAIVGSTVARHEWYEDQPGHVLLVSPPVFDMSMGAVWWAWSTGGVLEVVEGGPVEIFAAFEQAFRDESPVTHVIATPTFYAEVLNGLYEVDGWPVVVALGGEIVPPALVRQHFETAPGSRLFNEYGPTETAVWCAVAELKPTDGRKAAVPVGRSIPGCAVVLLDKRGQAVVADGQVGEVCVGGSHLAAGYFGEPELTARKFVMDPRGGRRYHTGDLGRWQDGALVIVGRSDDQVKIRGHRVELGEIETALHDHPRVRAAAVVVTEATDAEVRLVAHVVPNSADVTTAELTGYLRARLPEYMVPHGVYLVDALPRNDRGKIDRDALGTREPAVESDVDNGGGMNGTDTPDDLAGLVRRVWCAVLGVDEPDPDADFFAAGGDSIRAFAVRNRLHRERPGQLRLPIGAVFQAPTLRQLTDVVLRAADAPEAAVEVRDRTGELELSGPQMYWWYIDHYRGPGVISHPDFTINVHHWIDGPFDAAALDRAVRAVVERHEPLRTRLDFTAEGGVQEVLPTGPDLTHGYDVTGDLDQNAAITHCVADLDKQPFGTDVGRQLVAGVIRVSDLRHLVVLRMHHMVADDWSVRLIEKEVSWYYEREVEVRDDDLPALPMKYTDFADWQHRTFLTDRAWRDREPYRTTLDYWRIYTHGLKPVAIPEMTGPTDHAKVTLKATIDAAARARIDEIAREAGATPYAVLVTVFSWMLQRETGCDDVPVLATHHYRHNADVEDIIGLFFELVLVRSHYTPDMSFEDRLAETSGVIGETMSHLSVPMFSLCEEIEPLSTYMLNPFVCFELIPDQEGLALPGATTSRRELFTPDYEVSEFVCPTLIMLTAREEGDIIRLGLAYDRDCAPRPRMRRLLDHYLILLHEVLGTAPGQV